MIINGLNGLRVLVIEDEALIAMLLGDMLEQMGCTVVGPAGTMEDGWRLIETGGFDVAVIDVHLAGIPAYALGEAVMDRGVPIIVATGSGADGMPPRFDNVTLLPKPYSLPSLEAALTRARATIAA